MKFELHTSTNPEKKYMAIFSDGKKHKTIHFGQKGMKDYTQHKNPERKTLYLLRHKTRENWENPMTAGALSRWILWETPSLQMNIAKFKKRFRLE